MNEFNQIDENNEIDEIDESIKNFRDILVKSFPIKDSRERSYYYFAISEINEIKINNCYVYCYNSNIDKDKYYYRLVIDMDKSINSKIKCIKNKFVICQLLNKQLGIFDYSIYKKGDELENYNKFMLKQVKLIKETFDNLVFDKYHICFKNKDDNEKDINKVLLEKKIFSENCKVCIDDCVICFESCSTMTYCNHTLCVKCCQKIDKCAICRKDLKIDNNIYYDYDSNEENNDY